SWSESACETLEPGAPDGRRRLLPTRQGAASLKSENSAFVSPLQATQGLPGQTASSSNARVRPSSLGSVLRSQPPTRDRDCETRYATEARAKPAAHHRIQRAQPEALDTHQPDHTILRL